MPETDAPEVTLARADAPGGPHAHGGDPVPLPRGPRRRARIAFAVVLVPVLVATLVAGWLLLPDRDGLPTLQTNAPGVTFPTVTISGAVDAATQQVEAVTADGETVPVAVPPEYADELAPGDRVVVADLGDLAGEGVGHVFVDFVRGPPLLALAVAFAVLVVLVARWRGIAAIAGLGIALAVIGWFTLPALLDGKPAVPVALVTSVVIMTVVLYLAHGFTLRTSTALVGTLLGLVATAGLAAWASGAAHLTGLTGEDALDLRAYAPDVSLRAVLLCGIVLAGLGVLNDVTITQASAVWELHAAAPEAGVRRLFASGMRIGRDHIASTIYTIAFAYVGAALPLVLLVSMSDRPLLGALTSGELAEEVARTLVGSIGLVLAIPFTTAIAAVAVRWSGAARPPSVAAPAPPGAP